MFLDNNLFTSRNSSHKILTSVFGSSTIKFKLLKSSISHSTKCVWCQSVYASCQHTHRGIYFLLMEIGFFLLFKVCFAELKRTSWINNWVRLWCQTSLHLSTYVSTPRYLQGLLNSFLDVVYVMCTRNTSLYQRKNILFV